MAELHPIEKRIVNLIQKRDRKFLDLLYDHYSANLYGVVLRIVKDEIVAEDVMQESFVKIWRNAQNYAPDKAKLFTWLVTICRNTAIDKVRSLKHKRDNEIQSSESVVYKVADKKYNPELIDIEKHLGKLDIKYVDVLKALFFVGYTQQETCEQLNIPLGTVKTRLKIGLRELRKFYIESPILQVLMWISVL